VKISFHIERNDGFWRHAVFKTAVEVLILVVFSLLLDPLIRWVSDLFFPQPTLTPQEAEQILEANKFAFIFLVFFAVTVGPFIEELIFRFIPLKLVSLAKRVVQPRYQQVLFWGAGLLTSLVFAYVHRQNLEILGGATFLPIGQCVLGVYFWSLMAKRGYLIGSLGHLFYNLFLTVLVLVIGVLLEALGVSVF
jgi:membrane protease YdiL (CAAX protease family)